MKDIETIILAGIVILAVVYVSKNGLPTGQSIFNFQLPTSNGEQQVIVQQQIVTQRPDLRIVFSTLYTSTDVVTNCQLGGGEWHWDKDYIGCTNYDLALVDCSSPINKLAAQQCVAAGANVVCNLHNGYCKY